MMLYLWQLSSGNIAAPGLSIFLSAGACLCRKAKFNKNLHLALWLLKLQWETQGKYLFFKACSLPDGPLWSKASFYPIWT